MSHHNKHEITETQYAHLRVFLGTYAESHDITFAEMSRQANMGDGSIASVVRNRKPTWLFTRRLMQAFDVTEEQLLGPPEPAYVDIPGDPPMAYGSQAELPLGDGQQELLGLMRDSLRVMQDCLRELKGIHPTLQQCLGVLKDIHALNLASWEYAKEIRGKIKSEEERIHARIF